MGWEAGKFLGIKGQGIQSPIGESGQKSRQGLGSLRPLQIRDINMKQGKGQIDHHKLVGPGDRLFPKPWPPPKPILWPLEDGFTQG